MFLTQTILRQNAHPSGKPRRASHRNGAKKMNFGPVQARCPDHRATSASGLACPVPPRVQQARRLARCRGPDCPQRRLRDCDMPPRRHAPSAATTTRRAASAAPARAAARHRAAMGHWAADCAAGPACPARGRRARSQRRTRPARPVRRPANALASTVLARGSPGRPARLTRIGNPTGRDTRVTAGNAHWPLLLCEHRIAHRSPRPQPSRRGQGRPPGQRLPRHATRGAHR